MWYPVKLIRLALKHFWPYVGSGILLLAAMIWVIVQPSAIGFFLVLAVALVSAYVIRALFRAVLYFGEGNHQ